MISCIRRVRRRFGIDTSLVFAGRRARTASDFGPGRPYRQPEVRYARLGSTASTLEPGDFPELSDSVALSSGITCAISVSAADTVLAAGRSARGFIYDPNFLGLGSPVKESRLAAMLAAPAPHADLVTPAFPAETAALLGVETAEQATQALAPNGSPQGRLTQRSRRSRYGRWNGCTRAAGTTVVDQTGAGDVFAGTVAARLTLGDELLEAVRLGVAAAALSLSGQGGTGYLPRIEETRALLTAKE